MNEDQIQLKTVSKTDMDFLFILLNNRDPKNNISHNKMPSFKQHKKFVLSKPYLKWYVIFYNFEKIGTIYLSKQNEIGIHFVNKPIKSFVFIQSIKLLIQKTHKKKYFINISPSNLKYRSLFKKYGFNLIQQTYAIESNELS